MLLAIHPNAEKIPADYSIGITYSSNIAPHCENLAGPSCDEQVYV